MASKISSIWAGCWTPSGISMGWLLDRQSRSKAFIFSSVRNWDQISNSGKISSTARKETHVANPSLSQSWSHHSIPTRFPNHLKANTSFSKDSKQIEDNYLLVSNLVTDDDPDILFSFETSTVYIVQQTYFSEGQWKCTNANPILIVKISRQIQEYL